MLRTESVFSVRRTSLGRAVAEGNLSVRPSVCHTGDPRLRGSGYQNELYTVRQSDVSGFFTPDFIFLTLGVHPERLCQRASVESAHLTNNLQ